MQDVKTSFLHNTDTICSLEIRLYNVLALKMKIFKHLAIFSGCTICFML